MLIKQKYTYLITFLAAIILPTLAYASGSTFDASSCNVINIVMGTPGKVFAGFAVVTTGLGFFSGKMSWGLCLGIVGGIGVVFGAPSVVSAINGESMFVCQQGVQYVSTCEGVECFSCPAGFSGEDCDRCAIGYKEPDCNSCVEGYTGFNCSECDASKGYKSSGSYCYQACGVNFRGIKPGTVVDPTTTSQDIACDEVGFAGTISYSCVNNNFIEDPGEICQCGENRKGVNCEECIAGYDIAHDCKTLLSGFMLTQSGPKQECDITNENIIGIDVNSVGVVPPGQSFLGCTQKGYQGSIDYDCDHPNFTYTGSCQCEIGYNGPIEDCMASCDNANNFYLDPDSGECRKGCNNIQIDALTTSWFEQTINNPLSNENYEITIDCDATNYQGQLTYICDPDGSGFSISSSNCSCLEGYTNNDCLTCDEINGYTDINGSCQAGCTLDEIGSDVSWVPVSDVEEQIPCNTLNYEGNINYTCNNNNFQTDDICGCKAGFDISNNCETCLAGYSLINGQCQELKCVGGLPTLDGSKAVHIFNSSGELTCYRTVSNAEILVVGAGGSGGTHSDTTRQSNATGGGGGGGVAYVSNAELVAGTYTIVVGPTTPGKFTDSCNGKGNNGQKSIFRNAAATQKITANGGGGGGGCGRTNGRNGGSGGGAYRRSSATGGNATQASIDGFSGTIYGNDGGLATATCGRSGGGGGGAGIAEVGKDGRCNIGGNGGEGIAFSITGSSEIYGSGGGGHARNSDGLGGTNAGGRNNIDAVNNRGGGGGAVHSGTSGAGGSGIVVIRYTN